VESRFLRVSNLDIFEISSLFKKKDLTDFGADKEFSVSEPSVAHPVVRNSGRALVFSGETAVVHFELVLIRQVVVSVNILAGYDNDTGIQIAEGNLADDTGW
jgi:hypothetical protein